MGMTNEEREIALYCLKASSDYHSEVCEECVKYPNCDHMIQDDVTETIIKALEQTMWIPVSKELPEENIHVLCQFYMGGMAECYHAHGVWHIVGGYRISCDEVVAWMPLPEPYRESEANADDGNGN